MREGGRVREGARGEGKGGRVGEGGWMREGEERCLCSLILMLQALHHQLANNAHTQDATDTEKCHFFKSSCCPWHCPLATQ